MLFRVALNKDIAQIQLVRNSVTENVLSDPNLVTDNDCEEFMFQRGKGWVCEVDSVVVGFTIIDLQNNNVWALFIHPSFEKKGIGRKLHDKMLNWYFENSNETIWLSTSPKTRAELFYRNAGWMETGIHGKGEVKFEMTHAKWILLKG